MATYVSVTGFRPNGLRAMPVFWWRTLTSLAQARSATGIVRVSARFIDGTYHTMTVWNDRESMLRFVRSGAHLRAMRNFRVKNLRISLRPRAGLGVRPPAVVPIRERGLSSRPPLDEGTAPQVS
jgi:hypothetical protein